MIKVWYYKPWSPIHRIPAHLVFDSKGRQMVEVIKEKEQPNRHPLDRLTRKQIKNSMIEVDRW